MIFAALKWILSTLCNNAGKQVPQTSMPYVTLESLIHCLVWSHLSTMQAKTAASKKNYFSPLWDSFQAVDPNQSRSMTKAIIYL